MIGPLLIGALTPLLGVRAGFVICGALGLLFVLALGAVREPMPKRSAY
jgi:hypothetical protein